MVNFIINSTARAITANDDWTTDQYSDVGDDLDMCILILRGFARHKNNRVREKVAESLAALEAALSNAGSACC